MCLVLSGHCLLVLALVLATTTRQVWIAAISYNSAAADDENEHARYDRVLDDVLATDRAPDDDDATIPLLIQSPASPDQSFDTTGQQQTLHKGGVQVMQERDTGMEQRQAKPIQEEPRQRRRRRRQQLNGSDFTTRGGLWMAKPKTYKLRYCADRSKLHSSDVAGARIFRLFLLRTEAIDALAAARLAVVMAIKYSNNID